MISHQNQDSYPLRIFLLALFSLITIGLIGVRLFVLQVVNYEHYKNLSDSQHQLQRVLVPQRGEIFIRDHYSDNPYPVVTNVNRPTVYVVPQQVKDAPATAKKLAVILGMDVKDVLAKISDQSKKYVLIAKEIEEKKAEEITAEQLLGINLEDEIHQEYPEKQLAAQVLGFVAYDQNTRVGRYGLEYYFEKELAGTPGQLDAAKDSEGGWATGPDSRLTPAVDGEDLILTIDRAIQFKAEEVLARTVSAHSAKSGSVIVLNPKTGAILALANYPSFDPNLFNKVTDPQIFNNPVVQTSYEPGSVMKAITFAAGLDTNAVTPDMTYDDPGAVTLEKFTIRNAEGKTYGKNVTMTQVLDNSINTGAIFAEQKIGHETFRKYLEAFGFGQLTGVTLPFESKGSISNLDRGGDLYPATAAFGQGIMVTPLQMAVAYAVIANGGTLYQPFIVAEKIVDGKSEKIEPKLLREVISQRAASTISAMLVSVVEQGHGKRAAVPGYFIAGKTGTAQVAYTNRAGYDPNRSIGTFVGFGPVDNPAFVMLVKIDEPKDVKFAESTAAPAFGEIAQFILNYYQIPKSR